MRHGWCILFLPLIISTQVMAFGGSRPRPAPAPDSRPAPQPVPGPIEHGETTLRVLTYNVSGLPLPGTDHSRYRDIGLQLAHLRKHGLAPHVVAIQEGFHSRIEELVAASGYPHFAYGPPAKGLRLRSGLVVLSEFSIERVDRLVFDECASWDCIPRKGVLHVRLRVPEMPVPLEFYTTHMNSNPDTDPFTSKETTRRVREAQVVEMDEFMDRADLGYAPVLLIGDFNFRADEVAYRSFLDRTDAVEAAQYCFHNEWTCESSADAEWTWLHSVDHQFFREGRSPGVTIEPIFHAEVFKSKVNGRKLSDHNGLLFHYRLRW